MNLFQAGEFVAASGRTLDWKIECDALTDSDIETIAMVLAKRVPPFGRVEGVPRGGLRLATAMERYATEGPLLIVDDVWTTGGSWNAQRADRDAIGAVIFARGPVPPWVTPLFSMHAKCVATMVRIIAGENMYWACIPPCKGGHKPNCPTALANTEVHRD